MWVHRQRACPQLHPHWEKQLCILQAISCTNAEDLLVWLDADALILKDMCFSEALGHADMAMVRYPKFGHPNSGVVVMRNRPIVRQFWKTVFERGPLGDGHQIPRDEMRMEEVLVELWATLHCKVLDARWNACWIWDAVPAPVVRAWHGLPMVEKIFAMRAQLNTSQ